MSIYRMPLMSKHGVVLDSGIFTTPMRIIDFVCLLPTIMRPEWGKVYD